MAISNQLPIADSVIQPGDSFSFDIDDTYTSITIEVEVDGGVREFAYDSSLGGVQGGYTVAVTVPSAGKHRFTVTRSLGFDHTPFEVRVIENETGSSATTTYTYYLSGTGRFSDGAEPYYGPTKGRLQITLDNTEVRSDVGWIDLDSTTMSVTDLGEGKVLIGSGSGSIDHGGLTGLADDDHTQYQNTALSGSGVPGVSTGNGKRVGTLYVDTATNKVYSLAVNTTDANVWTNLTPSAITAPEMLAADLNCVLLYEFDGDLTDSSTTGEDLIANGGHISYWVPNRAAGHRALRVTDQGAGKSYQGATADSPAALDITGDMTMQVGLFVNNDHTNSAAHGSLVLGNMYTNVNDNREYWSLYLRPGGNAQRALPRFKYYNGSAGVSTDGDIELEQGNFYLIQCTREDVGGGSYTIKIYVNGLECANNTGKSAASLPATTRLRVGDAVGGQGDRLEDIGLHVIKISDRVLTAGELQSEREKWLGFNQGVL